MAATIIAAIHYSLVSQYNFHRSLINFHVMVKKAHKFMIHQLKAILNPHSYPQLADGYLPLLVSQPVPALIILHPLIIMSIYTKFMLMVGNSESYSYIVPKF